MTYAELSAIQDEAKAHVSLVRWDAKKEPVIQDLGVFDLTLHGPFVTGKSIGSRRNDKRYTFRLFAPHYFTRFVREQSYLEFIPLYDNLGFQFRDLMGRTSLNSYMNWVAKLGMAVQVLNGMVGEPQVPLTFSVGVKQAGNNGFEQAQCTIDTGGVLLSCDKKSDVMAAFDGFYRFWTIPRKHPMAHLEGDDDVVRRLYFQSSGTEKTAILFADDDIMFCSVCNIYLRTTPLLDSRADFAAPFPSRRDSEVMMEVRFRDVSDLAVSESFKLDCDPVFVEPRSTVSLSFDMPLKRRILVIRGDPLRIHTMPSILGRERTELQCDCFLDELDKLKKGLQVADFSTLSVKHTSKKMLFEAPLLQLDSGKLLDSVKNNRLFSKETVEFLQSHEFKFDPNDENNVVYECIPGRRPLDLIARMEMNLENGFDMSIFLQICAHLASILTMNESSDSYRTKLGELLMQEETLLRLFQEVPDTTDSSLFHFALHLVVYMFQYGNTHLFFVLLVNNRTWRLRNLRAPNILHSEYFLEQMTSRIAQLEDFLDAHPVQELGSISLDALMRQKPVEFADDLQTSIRLITSRILEDGCDVEHDRDLESYIAPFSALICAFLEEGFKKQPTAILEDLKSPWYLVQISAADGAQAGTPEKLLSDLVTEYSNYPDPVKEKLAKLITEGLKSGCMATWFVSFAKTAVREGIYTDSAPMVQSKQVLAVVDCLLALEHIWKVPT